MHGWGRKRGLAFHKQPLEEEQADPTSAPFDYLPLAEFTGSTAYYDPISSSCYLWQLAISGLQALLPSPSSL